jgi:ribosome maturation protein SDO1
MLASGKDLQESFGTSDPIAVCKEILDKGDLQVSEQERQAMLERLYQHIQICMLNCVNFCSACFEMWHL